MLWRNTDHLTPEKQNDPELLDQHCFNRGTNRFLFSFERAEFMTDAPNIGYDASLSSRHFGAIRPHHPEFYCNSQSLDSGILIYQDETAIREPFTDPSGWTERFLVDKKGFEKVPSCFHGWGVVEDSRPSFILYASAAKYQCIHNMLAYGRADGTGKFWLELAITHPDHEADVDDFKCELHERITWYEQDTICVQHWSMEYKLD